MQFVKETLSPMPENLVYSPRIYNKSRRAMFKNLRVTLSLMAQCHWPPKHQKIVPVFILMKTQEFPNFFFREISYFYHPRACAHKAPATGRLTVCWWTKAALYQHFLPVSRTLTVTGVRVSVRHFPSRLLRPDSSSRGLIKQNWGHQWAGEIFQEWTGL